MQVQSTSNEVSDEVPAGTTVGDYIVQSKIGEGGMATVYLALHPLIGKKVAVKVMAPKLSVDTSAVDRFVQEARSVNQIGHPNIVDVFSFGKLADGRSYFVMEWLAGQTLAERISSGPVSWRDAAIILQQVLDALDAAHAVGIVHRDLKPENVFLVPVRGGRTMVKLLDFGLAKLATDEEQGIRRTLAGMVVGTPAYISPEQARGGQVDRGTDIYALGIMMFELFVGHLPFQAEAVFDLVHQQIYDVPPDIHTLAPTLPRPLADGIMLMLSKSASERPSLALMREVLGLLTDDSTLAPQWQLRDSGQMTGPVAAPDDVAVAPRRSRLVYLSALLPFLVLLAVKTWPRHVAEAEPVRVVGPPAPVAEPAPPVAEPPPAPAPTMLVLYLDTPGVITLDGRVVASGNEAHLTVEPGPHELEVTARSRDLLKQAVALSAGQTLELSLSLPSLATHTPAKRAASQPQPTKPWGIDYMLDPFTGRR